MDENFKYLLEKMDHLVEGNAKLERINNENQRQNAEKLEKILVQATKTNGRVNALEDKQEAKEEELKELKNEMKELREEHHINKGRAKIINMLIGGAGAIGLTILGYALKFLKIFK